MYVRTNYDLWVLFFFLAISMLLLSLYNMIWITENKKRN